MAQILMNLKLFMAPHWSAVLPAYTAIQSVLWLTTAFCLASQPKRVHILLSSVPSAKFPSYSYKISLALWSASSMKMTVLPSMEPRWLPPLLRLMCPNLQYSSGVPLVPAITVCAVAPMIRAFYLCGLTHGFRSWVVSRPLACWLR